jgi:uncharacterized protein (UPF0297 family)
MAEFIDIVKDKLKEKGKQEVEELWEAVYNAYEEGGPNAVEETILKQLGQLKKGASREIKNIKEIIPKKKRRR